VKFLVCEDIKERKEKKNKVEEYELKMRAKR
jgi:hypothetical protein